jgi:N-acyl-D-amino-acid deacylase
MTLSLFIRNGRVLDGTGSPWFSADVAVEGDTVRMLPAGSDAQAERVIDARGCMVAPGFIDLHTYASLMPFTAPRMEPLARQGVTTVLVGLDGRSAAPYPSADLARQAAELGGGVEGVAPASAWWPTLDAYLTAVEKKASCNVATLVGNGTLRVATLGWADRPASDTESEAMARLLREAMEQGAFGLSSGLTTAPSSHAHTTELIALCAAIRPFGGVYVTRMRAGLGDEHLDPLREAVDIAKRSGVRLYLAHLGAARPGGARQLLDVLDGARDDGLDATFGAHPYASSVAPLLALLPQWAQAGGPHAVRARLRDKQEKLRISQDPQWLRTDFRAYLVTNLSRKKFLPYDGWPLDALARANGLSLIDAVASLLLEEQLAPSVIGTAGSDANVKALWQHPLHVATSGAAFVGERCHPRGYGAFAKALGDFCREERLLTLPDAVRRMTSLPARVLGLKDRGLLRDGAKADIVVFDPDRVGSRATLDEPRRFADGVMWTIVNGVPVTTPEGHTDAMPGRALRRGA